MTRAQAAARLLGLPLDHCDEELERALNNIEEAEADAHNVVYSAKQTKKQLRTLQAALKRVRAAHAALPETMRRVNSPPLDLQIHVEACDLLLAFPANTTKPPAIRQRQAAWEARTLLRCFGQPVTANRSGKWCRLAAILYGDPAADLSPYCRSVKMPD